MVVMIPASLFEQLDNQGYVVVPGFLDTQRTGAIRAQIDRLAPEIAPAELADGRRVHERRHPLPGAIMAQIITPALTEVAQAALKTCTLTDLRLLEQVLIRTDPRPPPHGPTGWHVDWAFFPSEYLSAPRQTYYHMVQACSTVEPGGGAFMIVPGSHHRTYAATSKLTNEDELAEFKRNPVQGAGVNLDEGIEVCAIEGDLIVFNPMCIHSASGNARSEPRYVYFSSFFDVSARRLRDWLRETNYQKGFHEDLRNGLPAPFRGLLDW
jgi:ectoine hydroxylase-related dioxygenase (phytanoyl-CoA dioxygenase family)